MDLDRLCNGERVAAVSAILLYVLMSFDWFGVDGSNENSYGTGLLPLFQSHSEKSAWEALDFISIILLIAIVAALAVAVLHSMDAIDGPPVPVNSVVAILGFLSVLLILFRIVVPPGFDSEAIPLGGGHEVIEFEGTAQWPMFLALLAAAGIAAGGWLARREEGPARPFL